MIALATYPIITPIINSVTFPFTFCDTYTISAITDKAPITAANESATSPIYPSLLSATPPNAPDSNTTKATPRLAPELIPSTEGPASGLPNRCVDPFHVIEWAMDALDSVRVDAWREAKATQRSNQKPKEVVLGRALHQKIPLPQNSKILKLRHIISGTAALPTSMM